MQLRAIIVDDEQKGIDSLNLLLKFFIKEVKVVATSTDAKAAIELIQNYKPEIVFLDINMPEMNGFELLEKLEWKEFNLIFTTAHQEYALRALKNKAIDYLLKPIDHEDLRISVDRVLAQVNNSNEVISRFNYNELLQTLHYIKKQTIIVNSRSGIESIDVDDILYLESQSNYTKLFLKNSREIVASKTLKDFEGQLCVEEFKFMRVHHSFIVNLNFITRYIKTSEIIVMRGEQMIPLSKSKREAFFTWLKV